MQDLMKQIIEMDKKARETTDAAQREKLNSEQEIVTKREQIRNEYLAQARRRITRSEPEERAAAEKKWEIKKAQFDTLMQSLDQASHDNMEKWTAELVGRVLGE